ncbi:TolC family protein [Fulvivirga sediminis]|uniref:TolC family protein n=1 Tax=Fulvivirga sediminis TaxID=2803949 RepID=A0A937FBW4_9BACT|nr:TolC family protein [Fulvivirga sediminis]MBL3657949.1 TolC family protein [Fulvivirga sediminis]
MRFKLSFVLGFMLLTVLARAQEDTRVAFSLKECIDYAMLHNQDILNSAIEKEIAETQVGETLSQGLPQVNINAGVNYNFEPQKSLLDVSTFDPTIPAGNEQAVSFQQKYDGNAAVSLSQLIFDGSFFVGLQASKTYKELSTKEYIKTEIDVVEAISKAYYNVLVSEERLILIRTNYSRVDTMLYETSVMLDNGFAERIDVSRLKVQHNNLKVELENTEKLLDLSRDMLKFQMGMPLAHPIELTDELEEVVFEDPSTDGDFNYASRIEYSQLQTNVALANLDLKNNKIKYLPTLYANLSYGYNTQTSDQDLLFKRERWLNYGLVGVSLSIPVFDGFLKSNKIQKNKLEIKQLNNSFEQLENSIDLEIKEASINMQTSLKQMQAQKENMELAEEIYDVTSIKYKEGVGSNLEVVEAEADYKEAQTNYYNALFNALVAKVELEKAYGQLHK